MIRFIIKIMILQKIFEYLARKIDQLPYAQVMILLNTQDDSLCIAIDL